MMPGVTTGEPDPTHRSLRPDTSVPRFSLAPVHSPELPGLASADLSPWFNPFLSHFVRESLRTGGTVLAAFEEGEVRGLALTDPLERTRSIFARSPELAQALAGRPEGWGVFSPYAGGPTSEAYGVYETCPGGEAERHRFRHRVRSVEPSDGPAILALTGEVYGAVNPRWFEGLAPTPEVGFVAEVDGEIAGVAWVCVQGTSARLHSVAVRAPFRRLGLGSDLLFARLWWAQASGATRVLSEIADANVPSRSLAERGGMRRVGEMYYIPAASADASRPA
jgi:GNAT superfamily N-acetyltransferase